MAVKLIELNDSPKVKRKVEKAQKGTLSGLGILLGAHKQAEKKSISVSKV